MVSKGCLRRARMPGMPSTSQRSFQPWSGARALARVHVVAIGEDGAVDVHALQVLGLELVRDLLNVGMVAVGELLEVVGVAQQVVGPLRSAARHPRCRWPVSTIALICEVGSCLPMTPVTSILPANFSLKGLVVGRGIGLHVGSTRIPHRELGHRAGLARGEDAGECDGGGRRAAAGEDAPPAERGACLLHDRSFLQW